MRHPTIEAVLAAKEGHAIVHGDGLAVMRSMPEGSVDLVMGSPPYEDARLYGELDYRVSGEEWVEWMVTFMRAAVRITRGLVVMVVGHGKTTHYRWSATPILLMADLARKGFHLRCPTLFSRVGIAGSGGPDYFRYDYEFCVVVQNMKHAKKTGRLTGQLPYSNNCAGGRPPKWGPGGEMSHRQTDGKRVTQWGGGSGDGGSRRPSGERQEKRRKGHAMKSRRDMKPRAASGERESQGYEAPTIANPGIVVEQKYGAREVGMMLGGGNVVHGNVGGGQMGDPLAHENEAPYPEWLVERHVLAFCPPGGVVLDPFCGSGTTLDVCLQNKRRAIGIDLRAGQVELAARRLASVQPLLVVNDDEIYLQRQAAKAAGKAGPPAQEPAAEDHQAAGEGPGLFDSVGSAGAGPARRRVRAVRRAAGPVVGGDAGDGPDQERDGSPGERPAAQGPADEPGEKEQA